MENALLTVEALSHEGYSTKMLKEESKIGKVGEGLGAAVLA